MATAPIKHRGRDAHFPSYGSGFGSEGRCARLARDWSSRTTSEAELAQSFESPKKRSDTDQDYLPAGTVSVLYWRESLAPAALINRMETLVKIH